eukprot:124028-Chlamydomonas_euryale.AAC.1
MRTGTCVRQREWGRACTDENGAVRAPTGMGTRMHRRERGRACADGNGDARAERRSVVRHARGA